MKLPINRKAFLFFLFFPMLLGAQNVATILTETWNETQWVFATRSLHEYDGASNLLSVTNQIWDQDTSSWNDASRNTYLYNPDDSISEMTTEIWNVAWVPTSHVLYTYTAFGKVESATTEMFGGGFWFPTSKILYNYDANEFLVNEVSQSWDFINNAFADSSRINYTNNPDGSVSTSINQTWNAGTATWLNETRNP